MKRYIVSTLAVLLVFALTMAVFAQSSEEEGTNQNSGQKPRRLPLLEIFLSIAKEQKSAVAAIEKHLETVKTYVEAQSVLPPTITRELDGQEMNVAMSQWQEERMKVDQQLQAEIDAIELQLMVLKLRRRVGAEHLAAQAELRAIADSATKENAIETAKLIRDLIDSREKAFGDKMLKAGLAFRATYEAGYLELLQVTEKPSD